MVDVIAWEVLNATADDWESVEQLHAAVVRSLAPVNRKAVAGVAERLVAAGLFEQRPTDAPPAEAWFRMTAAGRASWEQAADRYARQAEPLSWPPNLTENENP